MRGVSESLGDYTTKKGCIFFYFRSRTELVFPQRGNTQPICHGIGRYSASRGGGLRSSTLLSGLCPIVVWMFGRGNRRDRLLALLFQMLEFKLFYRRPHADASGVFFCNAGDLAATANRYRLPPEGLDR